MQPDGPVGQMEGLCSPETSVDFHRHIRRYIPGDRTLHGNCCKNLKSKIFLEKFSLDAQVVEKVPSLWYLRFMQPLDPTLN
jgi:hypothetical protein